MAGLDTRGAARGLRMGFNMADRVIARQDKREARKEEREWREERAEQEDQFRDRQLGLREKRQENQSEWREKEWERSQERYEDQRERQAAQDERAEELHDLKSEKVRYQMDQKLLQDGLNAVIQERDAGAATARQRQAGARLGMDFDALGSGKYEDARQKVTSALTKQVEGDVEAGMQPDMPGDASSAQRLNKRLNDPEMLDAFNTYLEPFAEKNIGREGRDGTPITDTQIVGAYSDDEGDIGFEMQVETSGGETYKAPVTTGRSGAEGDDKVKPVSADKLMDHVRGVTQITKELEKQSVQGEAKSAMRSRFPDSFEDPTYRSTKTDDGMVLWNENDPNDRVRIGIGGTDDGDGGGDGQGVQGDYTDLLEDHTEMRQRSSDINSRIESGFMDALGVQDQTMGVPQAYKKTKSKASATADKLDRMLLSKGYKLSESQLSDLSVQSFMDVPTKEELRGRVDADLTDDEVEQLYQKELEGARQQVMKRGKSLINRVEEEQRGGQTQRGQRPEQQRQEGPRMADGGGGSNRQQFDPDTTRIPEEGKNRLRANPTSKMKSDFNEKYGDGAADYILGGQNTPGSSDQTNSRGGGQASSGKDDLRRERTKLLAGVADMTGKSRAEIDNAVKEAVRSGQGSADILDPGGAMLRWLGRWGQSGKEVSDAQKAQEGLKRLTEIQRQLSDN